MRKYIIVGQGIAGTLIAFECLIRKIPFLVIDDLSKSRSSRVSAGIINPITGRKYLKSWIFEDLEKSLLEKYKSFKDLLGNEYLLEKIIYRSIPSIEDLNNWDASALRPHSQQYMESQSDISQYEDVVKKKFAYGKVKGYQLRVANLLKDFREYLSEHGLLIEKSFDHNELEISASQVQFHDLKAEHIIFCEGFQVIRNPYFNRLPFRPAKGELLLVKIPKLKTHDILKDQLFICPMQDDKYWVGATYAWENLSNHPTEEKRKWLIERLDKILNVPYEILDQLAGVRPATKFRKPLMGTHPEYKNVHLFNGLGTKGSSLAPYWAEKMMNYLENKAEIPTEVDLSTYL